MLTVQAKQHSYQSSKQCQLQLPTLPINNSKVYAISQKNNNKSSPNCSPHRPTTNDRTPTDAMLQKFTDDRPITKHASPKSDRIH